MEKYKNLIVTRKINQGLRLDCPCGNHAWVYVGERTQAWSSATKILISAINTHVTREEILPIRGPHYKARAYGEVLPSTLVPVLGNEQDPSGKPDGSNNPE